MKYILKNANVWNGTKDMKLKKNVSILVEDGKIQKIGKVDELPGVKVIDLNGKYVIPGLINMHVHLPGSGSPSSGKSDSKKLVKLLTSSPIFTPVGVALGAKFAKEELFSGVTTLRAVGGVADFDTRLRDQIAKGKKDGPRLLVANSAITVRGGHMEGTVSLPADTIEDAVKLVDQLYNQKVDLIKVMITGGVLDAEVLGEPGVLKMKPEFVKAITTRAHEYGLPVAAHVESFEGTRVALENGVDTIEHGSDVDEDTIALFEKTGAKLVATISPALPIGLLPEEVSGFNHDGLVNSCVVAKNIINGAKKLVNTNVLVGLGTDTGCPFTTHYNFWRELEWAENALHMGRPYALYLATLSNAKILGKDNEFGSIEVGKYADMVVCDKDPIETFKNIRDPFMVIKEGKIYKQPKVKKNPIVENALDSLMDIDLYKELANYSF